MIAGTPQPAKVPAGAFSLLELLVVIAVISLLLSVMLPSLGRAKHLAKQAVCASNLRQIAFSMEYYLDANDRTYPCAEDPISTDPFYWLWMGRGWRGLVGPYIQEGIDGDNPSVLVCPDDPDGQVKYESTSYAYSMCFYHSNQQIDGTSAVADTYSNPQPSVPRRNEDVANPSRKILIGEWTSNHRPVDGDNGWWCWAGYRNFMLADSSIACLDATDIRPANDNMPDANLTAGGLGGEDCGKGP